MPPAEPDRIIHADNLDVLPAMPDGSFTLAYLHPPANPRRDDAPAAPVRGVADAVTGFQGRGAAEVKAALLRYDDRFAEYWAFLEPRLVETWRLLARDGSLYLRLDAREAHYAKVLLDALFGRASFLNEIVWAYDFGETPERTWPARHDTILVYVKDPKGYWFDSQAVDREPYMAPGLVTAEKASLGKLPTDVWWHTIVGEPADGRTPEGVVRRILQASTREGDRVLDPFAGSGTTGAVAATLGRRFVLIDADAGAVDTMRARFGGISGVVFEEGAPASEAPPSPVE